MLAHNFIRKPSMNVIDILQDKIPDKIFSSVLFTLVNLPYRDNSIDIENILIDNSKYRCYSNHYRFNNGTMIIIKIASKSFVPYGIYARKIINFLIAEFTYKKNLPHIYDKFAQQMINLGAKPLDFIEKLCGTRNPGGKRKKIILQQLQSILNCRMAIATGYKQLNPKDDEMLASDKYQFALVELENNVANHEFDVMANWQEEIYISDDLAKILSQHIMPLDKEVYDAITSPMELDIYQYFTYQNYNNLKRNNESINYIWDDMLKLFGRGYAKNSQGMAGFRRDFRKSIEELSKKTNLAISAPNDSKTITFKPINSYMIANKSSTKNWQELEYESYQPIIENLPQIEELVVKKSEWDNFCDEYSLNRKFDTNAINYIKKYFEQDSSNTIATVKYVLEQSANNPSAFVKKLWQKTG